jgi:hypothetical protein
MWMQSCRSLSEQYDIHAHLMSVYNGISDWWYLTTIGVMGIRYGARSSVYGLLYSSLPPVSLLKFMVIIRIRVLNIYVHCPHWYPPGYYGLARWT